MGSVALCNHDLVSKEPLIASAVFARSNKVLGWQPAAPKVPGARFSEKKSCFFFFEFHRTSETSMGSLSLQNHVYGLYRIFTTQSSVCKIH